MKDKKRLIVTSVVVWSVALLGGANAIVFVISQFDGSVQTHTFVDGDGVETIVSQIDPGAGLIPMRVFLPVVGAVWLCGVV